MINKPPGGALRLLTTNDIQAFEEHLASSIIGWIPTSQGAGGLHNPRGFAFMRVVVQKILEGGILKDLYDQPLIFENAGSVVIPQLGDKIGFVQNFRLNGERIATTDPGYIKALNDEGRWEELVGSLGNWHWELPAGLAPDHNGEMSLEKIALAAAKLEAQEEGGFTISEARIIGKINFNPTFFAHAQYVVHGTITAQGEQAAEDLEILGGVQLFTPQEIRGLIHSGDLEDGRSLSALALLGERIPTF